MANATASGPIRAQHSPSSTTTTQTAQRGAAKSARIDQIIAEATAEGKCSPAVEPVWRAVGEQDITLLESLVAVAAVNPALAGLARQEPKALEKLFEDTPANPVYSEDVCYSAEREVDRILHPILNDLMSARATIDAFSEAAFNEAANCAKASTKLYWPSLMDSIKKVTPSDDDLDNAITQIYGVLKKAVTQAVQVAATSAIAAGLVPNKPVHEVQGSQRKRDKLVARTMETTK